MMSQGSKWEMVETIRPRYLKADKKGKEHILDEFVATCGYHRKYAIRLLKHGHPVKSNKRGRKTKEYTGEVVEVLRQIWEICGRICSKRLQPYLPEIIKVLERTNELVLASETKRQLLKMSRATIDRRLHSSRLQSRHGLSTTKPGSLLKKSIPVRTWTEWDDARPGFVEIDLVAHCGNSVGGQYLNTLTVVDVSTGWTECLALLHRSQTLVFEEILNLRQRLPFPLLGIDSDNGSEFINELLYGYCLKEEITFTRSRPYKKNDQARVEQKNWSVVRHTIGYDRYETVDELAILRAIYADLRLYVNFFQPVQKLISSGSIDGRFIKRYDVASTPYHRVLSSKDVSLEDKAHLLNLYVHLNPVTLRNSIDQKVAYLWKLIR